MSADGFLSRWSRRKLEARKTEDLEPRHADKPAEPPAARQRVPSDEAVELSPDELATLPRIEDLTAEADLAPFLRAGVPRLLRQAALRRMWSLDPAIRDYVGDARDYSYDWNVPGGVPVSGPLAPEDDPVAAVGRMFSRGQEEAAAAQIEPAQEGEDVEAVSAAPGGRPAEGSGGSREASPPGCPSAEPPDPASAAPARLAERQTDPVARLSEGAGDDETRLAGAPLRRHGSARPKLD